MSHHAASHVPVRVHESSGEWEEHPSLGFLVGLRKLRLRVAPGSCRKWFPLLIFQGITTRFAHKNFVTDWQRAPVQFTSSPLLELFLCLFNLWGLQGKPKLRPWHEEGRKKNGKGKGEGRLPREDGTDSRARSTRGPSQPGQRNQRLPMGQEESPVQPTSPDSNLKARATAAGPGGGAADTEALGW